MRQPKLLKSEILALEAHLIDLRDEGHTQKEAARIVGRNKGSVAVFCFNHSIKGWPRGAAARDQTGNKNPKYIDGLSKSTIRRTTRQILLDEGRNIFVCDRCENRSQIELHRHHKDRDRTNNVSSNLEILCQNCHNNEHLKERDQFRGIDGRFEG